jgi:hypothetical protein
MRTRKDILTMGLAFLNLHLAWQGTFHHCLLPHCTRPSSETKHVTGLRFLVFVPSIGCHTTVDRIIRRFCFGTIGTSDTTANLYRLLDVSVSSQMDISRRLCLTHHFNSVENSFLTAMAATFSSEILLKSDNLRKIKEFDTLSKLRQGYRVTDVEKETLHNLTSGAEAEAKLIDTEISRLRALILELENSRDLLLNTACQARSLIAPIRKLPPEILGEIFFLTYSPIHLSDDWYKTTAHPPTVVAGNVCSSWHAIAISTQKLWSCITITLEYGLPPSVLQRFKEVLELSGNALLDLMVKIPRWLAFSVSSAVFPVIHQHSQRCKHLTLNGHPYFVVQFFRINPSPHSGNSESGTLSPQLPSLRSLEIDVAMDEDPEDFAPTVLHISSASAPNLRNVSIMKTYDDHGGLSFDLPWRQVGTLMFGARYLSEFFDTLSKCTSVTQACLHDCLIVDQTQHLHPISSDTLTSLRFRLIDDIVYNAMCMCFNKFTLPYLRELHVYANQAVDGEDYYRVSEWPIETFRTFVNRSGFPITILSILGVPMRDSTLIAILECMPRLEEVVIEEPRSDRFVEGLEAEGYKLSCLTNHLMERLKVRRQESAGLRIIGDPVNSADANRSNPNCEAEDPHSIQEAHPFLPCLREIKLKGKGSLDTFSFGTFLEMVRTRRAPTMVHHEGNISILKRVELRVWLQRIDEAIQKEIDSLRDGGLILDVIYDNIQMNSNSDEE